MPSSTLKRIVGTVEDAMVSSQLVLASELYPQCIFQLRSDSLSKNIASIVGALLSEASSQAIEPTDLVNDPDCLVISVATGMSALQFHRNCFSNCRSRDHRFFPVSIHTSSVIFGPLIIPGQIPCLECVAGCLDLQIEREGDQHTGPDNALEALLGALIVQAVRRSALQVDQEATPRAHRVRLPELQGESLPVGRLVGCATCWPSRNGSDERLAYLSSVFEVCARARADNQTRTAEETRGTSASAQLEDATRIHLPNWADLYDVATNDTAGRSLERADISKTNLASFLFLTFGQFDASAAQSPDRVMPSAGNLGSCEVYLLANHVLDLASALYRYNSVAHALDRVPVPPYAFCDLLKGCSLNAEGLAKAPAVVIMTGAYERIARKYQAFGYRLVHFDAGVSLARAAEIGGALGWSMKRVAVANEAPLRARLFISRSSTPVTAVFAITREPEQELYTSFTAQNNGFMAMPHVLQPESGPIRARDLAFALDQASLATNAFIDPLPPLRQPHVRSLKQIWERALLRRSWRYFRPSDLSLRTVEQIGASALANCGKAASDLRLFVSLQRQPYALDTYAFEGKKLQEHACRLPLSHGQSLFIDERLETAPVFFWVCADVALPPRRYRELLLNAGQLAAHLMSTVDEHGFAGVITAGIRAEAIAKACGLLSLNQTPLVAYVAGERVFPISGGSLS